MALLIPADEISNRDYIPEEGRGTVLHVRHQGDHVILKFLNGNEHVIHKDTELMVEQGGRF